MKYLLYGATIIMVFFSIANSQRSEQNRKIGKTTDTTKVISKSPRKSVLRSSELTVLAGFINGPVYVGGYWTDDDGEQVKSHALLWKILGSNITLKEFPGRIDYSFWLDEQTGWISAEGSGRYYKTTDSGNSWVEQPFPSGVYGNVFFLDKTRGWYFGYNQFLMRVDGEKIQQLTSFENYPRNRLLQFVTTDIGWLRDVIDGRSRFQKSEDGGKTWHVLEAPFSEVDHFQFLNEYNGYVLTPEGLYLTADGGFSWSLVFNGGKKDWISKIYFLSPEVGWTLGSRVCMTKNAGRDWKCEKLPKLPKCDLCDTIKGFVFTNENDGWVLFGDRLFFTTDGGRSWKRKFLSFGNARF